MGMRSYRILGGMAIGIGTAIQIMVIWSFWSAGQNLAVYDSINVMVASVMVAVLIFLLGDRLLAAPGRRR